jgi:hypothetical protein
MCEKNQLAFSRYDCVDKFSKYMDFYINFYRGDFKIYIESLNKYKKICFLILKHLEKQKLLSSFIKKIVIKKATTKEPAKIISHKFLILENYTLYNNRINFNIYFKPPKIKKIKKSYYYVGEHYSTMLLIFKTNSRSNKSFELENLKLLEKISSSPYSIDFNMYEQIYKLICKDLNITDNSKIESHIIADFREKYHKKLFNEGVDTELEPQSNYNKYLLYYIFSQIKFELEYLKKFYLASSFDFRGRIYSHSNISPMGPSIFRYLYFYGYYSSEELKTIEFEHLKQELKNLIKKSSLFAVLKNIDLKKHVNLTYIKICLFELGKINKSKLIKKKNGCLTELDFLQEGIDLLEIHGVKPKFEDMELQIQYLYILSGLVDLNKGLYKKLIIYKDATASGIQLLTIILGGANNDVIKNCNLNSKTH